MQDDNCPKGREESTSAPHTDQFVNDRKKRKEQTSNIPSTIEICVNLADRDINKNAKYSALSQYVQYC